MNIISIFVLIAIVSYFIGTINFSKIIAWYGRHKDITKVGSGNPGTMNMLRSFGFKLALFTFLAEVVKAGVTCIVCKIVTPEPYSQVAFWLAGLFILLGYNFPVWSKFKGGKGVACFAGVFLFSELWYVAIAWFFVCATILYFMDYGAVASFIYLTALAIAQTIFIWLTGVPYAWAITAIIWFLVALTYIRHHANIYRLIHHTENKVGFADKLKKFFCHKKGEEIISEDEIEQKAETEIVVEDDETDIIVDDEKDKSE